MKQQGFTLVETVIVMGIISILFGFVTINMWGTQQKASLNSLIAILVSDISSQQIKAMSGTTEGSALNKYGVYFEERKYTLFRGDIFLPSDSFNFVVNLDSTIRFSDIKLPNSTIVFLQGNGEVSGYDVNNNRVTVITNDGKSKTLSINKYGALSE